MRLKLVEDAVSLAKPRSRSRVRLVLAAGPTSDSLPVSHSGDERREFLSKYLLKELGYIADLGLHGLLMGVFVFQFHSELLPLDAPRTRLVAAREGFSPPH